MKFRAISIFIVLFPVLLFAREIPKPSGWVNDYAGVLSLSEKQSLENKLKIYNDTTSSQIGICIENEIPDNLAVFDRSHEIARAWNVGAKNMQSGILIYVAIKNRKFHIQTANNVQKYMSGSVVGKIESDYIRPNFRSGNYFLGLDGATDAIIKQLSGKFAPEVAENESNGFLFIIIAIVILIIIISIFGKGNNGHRGFRGRGAYWFPTSGWSDWSGGGGTSSGGSSWGGFGGGGGFDGGGAGGSW